YLGLFVLRRLHAYPAVRRRAPARLRLERRRRRTAVPFLRRWRGAGGRGAVLRLGRLRRAGADRTAARQGRRAAGSGLVVARDDAVPPGGRRLAAGAPARRPAGARDGPPPRRRTRPWRPPSCRRVARRWASLDGSYNRNAPKIGWCWSAIGTPGCASQDKRRAANLHPRVADRALPARGRSEERRVGKERGGA